MTHKAAQTAPTIFFLHGLDSSSQGRKGRWFQKHFPQVVTPDFTGDLKNRVERLETLCRDRPHLILIGSSFGGLMATCYAAAHPEKCRQLILLAPALNFPEYHIPDKKIEIPALLIIGKQDEITPPARVLPLAEKSFSRLQVTLCDDDHLLHRTFAQLQWKNILQEDTFKTRVLSSGH